MQAEIDILEVIEALDRRTTYLINSGKQADANAVRTNINLLIWVLRYEKNPTYANTQKWLLKMIADNDQAKARERNQ